MQLLLFVHSVAQVKHRCCYYCCRSSMVPRLVFHQFYGGVEPATAFGSPHAVGVTTELRRRGPAPQGAQHHPTHPPPGG